MSVANGVGPNSSRSESRPVVDGKTFDLTPIQPDEEFLHRLICSQLVRCAALEAVVPGDDKLSAATYCIK